MYLEALEECVNSLKSGVQQSGLQVQTDVLEMKGFASYANSFEYFSLFPVELLSRVKQHHGSGVVSATEFPCGDLSQDFCVGSSAVVWMISQLDITTGNSVFRECHVYYLENWLLYQSSNL